MHSSAHSTLHCIPIDADRTYVLGNHSLDLDWLHPKMTSHAMGTNPGRDIMDTQIHYVSDKLFVTRLWAHLKRPTVQIPPLSAPDELIKSETVLLLRPEVSDISLFWHKRPWPLMKPASPLADHIRFMRSNISIALRDWIMLKVKRSIYLTSPMETSAL